MSCNQDTSEIGPQRAQRKVNRRWLSNHIGISGGLNQYAFCGNVDSVYKTSRHLGGISRDLLMTAAIPNLGTWLKNPAMYELGSTTVSPATWKSIQGLDAIGRGKYLLNEANGSIIRASLQGFSNGRQFGKTIFTGLTPGANLFLIGGLEAFDSRTR